MELPNVEIYLGCPSEEIRSRLLCLAGRVIESTRDITVLTQNLISKDHLLTLKQKAENRTGAELQSSAGGGNFQ